MFSELFKEDIDAVYNIIAKAPKRLLFAPSSKYLQRIDKNDEIVNKIKDKKIQLLVVDFISYFNHYSSSNMDNINKDIDMFIPAFKKKYKYKKKHLNKLYKYIRKGLLLCTSDIKKNWDEDPNTIESSINEYKRMLILRYLTRK
jgi:hypothetical protein